MSEEPRLRRARATFARLFQEYWRGLCAQFANDAIAAEFAAARSPYFFGGTSRQRLSLARDRYSLVHARALASWSEDEVAARCAPWLDELLEEALDELRGGAYRKRLRQTIEAEYVLRVEQFGGGVHLAPYPTFDVLYDDLYERTAGGVSVGASVVVYKATGEPFTEKERRWAERGVERDFRSGQRAAGDSDTAWSVCCEDLEDDEQGRALAFSISDDTPIDDDDGEGPDDD